LYEPFSSGLHAESGGESIDDSHDQLLAMLSRFGLSTEHRALLKPYDSVVFYKGQRTTLAPLLGANGGAGLTDYLRFEDAVSALGDNVDPDRPEDAPNAAELDATSLETFVRDQHLVPEAEFLVRLQNKSEYNAELKDISLLFVAQQSAASSGGVGGLGLTGSETMRVVGGKSRLPELMAQALGPTVQTSSPVSVVEHSATGVRVHARGSLVDAAWLIIAAPLMPMRKVTFQPALPTSVAATIVGLDLGAAAKVIREYAAPFWQAEGSSGFTLTDLPFTVGWAASDSEPLTLGGIFSQFITGDAARYAASLPDDRRRAVFQGQLDTVYPEGRLLMTPRGATMAWANEPYTGGGYAVFRPGQMAPFWPVLRDGTGRIRFAGEHTSGLAGYMESAVRSGHRAAQQIGVPTSTG